MFQELKPTRRIILVTGLGLPAIITSARARPKGGQAQDWPTRPVTIVAPFAAGGPTDMVARMIAHHMQTEFGVPVVVENRVGALGEVGTRYVVRSAPDGYTLLVGSASTFGAAPAVRRNLSYDPLRDLSPISLAVTAPHVLVVNPEKVPARDVAGTVEWLKRNGWAASYGSSGVGSAEQLTMEMFKQRTGTDATHVPYAGGAPAVTDLLGGSIQLAFLHIGSVVPHVQAGRLRAVVQSGKSRDPSLPDVPVAEEAGLQNFVSYNWQAIMAPAQMDPGLIRRLQVVAAAGLRSPDAAHRLHQGGYTVAATDADQYREFLAADIRRWRAVAERSNIHVD